MKKIIFVFTTILCFAAIQTNAQIRYGFQAGMSSFQLDKESVQTNGASVAIQDAKYGFHIGAFARAKLTKHWYLQPEANFNSSSVDFQVSDFSDGLMDKVLTEKYRYLDIPLMLGYKLGPLRVEAGPTGHVYVASKSELGQIGGYEKRFNNFNLGYQAGFGLDIWKLMIGLRHEGNFEKFGDHMSIGGQQLNFSQRPSRWLMTVGFSF